MPPNAQTHSSQPFTRVSVYLVALGVSACSAAPVELEFESGDTGDLKTGDGVRHPSATPEEDGPSQPSPSVEPGFSPGPTCPAFPSACSDPDRPKCTVVSEDPGFRSSCVPQRGDVAIGESCERRVRGDDDCAPGGYCSPLGQSFERDNRLVCQQLCKSSDECADGEACLQLLSEEMMGVCVPRCALFEDEACGAEELRCAAAAQAGGGYFGYCEIFGSLGEGEACTLSSQCGRGLSCELASQKCRYSCDEAHACPGDLRCVPLQIGVPGALRLCVP